MSKPQADFSKVPPELIAMDHWVSWKFIPKDGRMSKEPFVSGTKTHASSTKPATWRSFTKAVSVIRNYDGIGFVVSNDDPYCGVDIDHCISKETGAISPVALEIVENLNSYTEITPSGEGLRVWVRGKIPSIGRRKMWRGTEVEMYDSARYFTVTGRLMPEVPPTIEERQAQLIELHGLIWGNTEAIPETKAAEARPVDLDDAQLVQLAMNARNGHRFTRLWRGETSDHNHDDSRADSALCFHLAFWTGGDPNRMDKLFRQSGLYRPKWDEKRGESGTYGSDTVRKACQKVTTHYNPHQPAARQAADSEGRSYMRTDLGNAERLSDRFGNNMRWWDDRQNFFVWDNRRWLEDRTLQVYRWARDTVRSIYRESEGEEDAKRTEINKWAAQSESAGKLTAMVTLCRFQQEIPIEAGTMDGTGTEWLFNTLNGTVDLRTGHIRPCRREDLISKLAPVSFDALAKCPQWDAFLMRVMDEDQDLIDYLARVVGYCLTGIIRDKAVFIAWGTNDTGKSTFLETVRRLMGDYAGNLRPESIMVRRNEAVPHDIAKLEGCRFVTVGETEQGQRMASALVKRFSGGDIMSARFNYDKREHDFSATFKLIIGTNHKPVIRDDTAWNRIRLIPFAVPIPKAEQDGDLREKLAKELPGILNWAISGCMDWQKRKNLDEPGAVLAASEEYKTEMDPLIGFLEERCVMNLAAWTPTSDIRRAYEEWAAGEGATPVHPNVLAERFRNLGCSAEKQWVNGGYSRGWRGIEIHLPDTTYTSVRHNHELSEEDSHARPYGNGVRGVRRRTVDPENEEVFE